MAVENEVLQTIPFQVFKSILWLCNGDTFYAHLASALLDEYKYP